MKHAGRALLVFDLRRDAVERERGDVDGHRPHIAVEDIAALGFKLKIIRLLFGREFKQECGTEEMDRDQLDEKENKQP